MIDIANKHHHIQSFVVGQYITANIFRLDRAAADNKRILYRIVDIAGSKEQPGYKLRCLYGLLNVAPWGADEEDLMLYGWEKRELYTR